MNLLNRLTIKNLKLNKKRTIVTIIGIILSVSLITAVSSMYASAISSAIEFETTQKGDFHVAFYDIPINEIDTFNNNRKIESIYLTQNIGYAKLEESKNEYKPYVYIKAFTKDALENLGVKLQEGKLPESDNEIVIPTHLKTNGRVTLNIGDSITLDVGTRIDSNGNVLDQSVGFKPQDTTKIESNADTQEIMNVTNENKSNESIINTTKKTYKIVGIIERPANNIEEYSAPGYTFITYVDKNDLSSKVDIYAKYTKSGTKENAKVTANILDIDAQIYENYKDEGRKSTDEEREKIDNELKKAKYKFNENAYLISLETHPITGSGVGELGVVVAIVCGIIVFTSVFCIKNSFDISITEKIKQYGMLRSIGATKKQIRKNVFYEATILGLIGIPLGILAGYFASYILIIVSGYFLSESFTTGLKLKFSFSYIAMIIAILLGIITIYLSAIRSARKAAKISPIDSIRNSSGIKIKSKKLRSSKLISKFFGIGGEISYKNLKRNKKKYRTTVISIVVSVSVFIALSTFMKLAFLTVEEEINLTDYNLYLSIDDNDIYNKALETTKLEGIKNYTVYRSTSISIKNVRLNDEYKKMAKIEDENDGNKVAISVVGKEQYDKYIKNLGLEYDDVKNKAILIDNLKIGEYDEEKKDVNYKRVRQFLYKKGDTIEGTLDNGEKMSLQIACVTDELPFGLKNNTYNSIAIVSDEFFETFAKTNRCVIYYDASNATKLQDEIDNTLKDNNYSINNIEENAKIMRNLYTLVGIFLYGFIIVISLIGITNIFNTITTNMELRKPEFAMLKSIGMTEDEFSKMIRLESIFMGIKSLIFGIPIGVGLSYLIYNNLASEGIKYAIPYIPTTIAVCTVFILISFIMKYSMNKINKQNTIETIRNENI